MMNMMTMNEPISKWHDGSVEDKIKKNQDDKTFIFPFLKIFFYSLIFAVKKQKNIINNLSLIFYSIIYLLIFLKNDINFLYKNLKKIIR